ncbi:MAG: RsmE family RNA methyltransferase, partial [Spirochaetota bacterium]
RILLCEKDLDNFSRIELNNRQARHLREVLKAKVGSSFEAGLINSPISGEFRVEELGPDASVSGYFVGKHDESQTLRWQNFIIAIGIMRPPVLKRLLRDLASAGVEEIILLQAELCEGDYCKSHLWDELEKFLILGAEQGRINRLPRLSCGERRGLSLTEYLAKVEQIRQDRAVLPQNCLVFEEKGCPVRPDILPREKKRETYIVALGPERGWTARELKQLRNSGFADYSLGCLTMRTEVAAHLALGLYLLETRQTVGSVAPDAGD